MTPPQPEMLGPRRSRRLRDTVAIPSDTGSVEEGHDFQVSTGPNRALEHPLSTTGSRQRLDSVSQGVQDPFVDVTIVNDQIHRETEERPARRRRTSMRGSWVKAESSDATTSDASPPQDNNNPPTTMSSRRIKSEEKEEEEDELRIPTRERATSASSSTITPEDESPGLRRSSRLRSSRASTYVDKGTSDLGEREDGMGVNGQDEGDETDDSDFQPENQRSSIVIVDDSSSEDETAFQPSSGRARPRSSRPNPPAAQGSSIHTLPSSSDSDEEEEEAAAQPTRTRRSRLTSAPTTTATRNERYQEFVSKRNKQLWKNHPELTTAWDSLDTLLARPSAGMVEQPQDLSLRLLPFQREGVAWMLRQEETEFAGGILSDEMGMGKTIQTIALILAGREAKGRRKGRTGSNLIIAPTVAIMQWHKEIITHTSGTLSVLLYHGPKRTMDPEELADYDVILTSCKLMSRCAS